MPEHLLIANGNGKGGVGVPSVAVNLTVMFFAQLLLSSTHPINSQIKAPVSQAVVE